MGPCRFSRPNLPATRQVYLGAAAAKWTQTQTQTRQLLALWGQGGGNFGVGHEWWRIFASGTHVNAGETE